MQDRSHQMLNLIVCIFPSGRMRGPLKICSTVCIRMDPLPKHLKSNDVTSSNLQRDKRYI